VQRAQRAVRLRGHDRGGLKLLAVRSGPHFPQARERNRAAGARPNRERLAALALGFPFIRIVGRNEAATPGAWRTQGRLCPSTLSLRGVDQQAKRRAGP